MSCVLCSFQFCWSHQSCSHIHSHVSCQDGARGSCKSLLLIDWPGAVVSHTNCLLGVTRCLSELWWFAREELPGSFITVWSAWQHVYRGMCSVETGSGSVILLGETSSRVTGSARAYLKICPPITFRSSLARPPLHEKGRVWYHAYTKAVHTGIRVHFNMLYNSGIWTAMVPITFSPACHCCGSPEMTIAHSWQSSLFQQLTLVLHQTDEEWYSSNNNCWCSTRHRQWNVLGRAAKQSVFLEPLGDTNTSLFWTSLFWTKRWLLPAAPWSTWSFWEKSKILYS